MNRTFRRLLLLVAVVPFLGVGPGSVNTWNGSYEAAPPNTDPVSEGDDWVRKDKEEMRRRVEVEHQVGTGFGTTSGDNGLHRVGSARCFYADAAPTVLFDNATDWDNTGGAGTGTLSATETNEPGRATQQTVGQARCWVDEDGADNIDGTIDDNAWWIYNQDPNGDTSTADAAWEQVTGGFGTGGSLLNYSNNLALNGDFELGAGVAAPDGWTAVNTPTLAYSSTDASEGDGQELHVTAAGGANEGISKAYALKGSTTYLGVVRALATAGDTCSLRSTSGASNMDVTTVGDTTYETLVGTFTTDAAGSAVTVFLEADTDTDICKFDHFGLYAVGTGVYHPAVPDVGSWSDNTAISNAASPHATSQTYIIGAPGCYFRGSAVVNGSASIAAVGPGDTHTADVDILLEYNNNGAGCTTDVAQGHWSFAGNQDFPATAGVTLKFTVPVSGIVNNLTPGQTGAFCVTSVNNSGCTGGGCAVPAITIETVNNLAVEQVCPGS